MVLIKKNILVYIITTTSDFKTKKKFHKIQCTVWETFLLL